MDNKDIEAGECIGCGEIKPIYAHNSLDPFTTEINPEWEEGEHTYGDWCEACWDERIGDI